MYALLRHARYRQSGLFCQRRHLFDHMVLHQPQKRISISVRNAPPFATLPIKLERGRRSIHNDRKQPCCSSKCVNKSTEGSSTTLQWRTRIFWQDQVAWKKAAVNTLHCLVGCSIGDFGMLYACASFNPSLPMYVVMPAAMGAGIFTSTLLEMMRLKWTIAGLSWKQSFNTAMRMSFVSMLAMEITENVVDLLLMNYSSGNGGLQDAGLLTAMNLDNPMFLFSLGTSMLAGFLAPLPYNYYVLKKYGKSCH